MSKATERGNVVSRAALILFHFHHFAYLSVRAVPSFSSLQVGMKCPIQHVHNMFRKYGLEGSIDGLQRRGGKRSCFEESNHGDSSNRRNLARPMVSVMEDALMEVMTDSRTRNIVNIPCFTQMGQGDIDRQELCFLL